MANLSEPHSFSTPCIESNFTQTNASLDVNSALPVHPSITSVCTRDAALPSGGLPSKNEPTTHTTHDCATGDVAEEHLINTTVVEEPIIEVVIDVDRLENHKDRDLSVVMFRDKGKQVDPREYGGATSSSISTMVPTGITRRVELVDVHLDQRKNDGPSVMGNRVAKYESGPSRIDFPSYMSQNDSESNVLHKLHLLPLQSSELEDNATSHGPPCDSTPPRLRWHPKISPYRLLVFSIPAGIGTAKAISSQKGNITTPVTLEWISGVVVFLV